MIGRVCIFSQRIELAQELSQILTILCIHASKPGKEASWKTRELGSERDWYISLKYRGLGRRKTVKKQGEP